MEKTVTTLTCYCDFCGATAYNKCLACGKDICWKCAKDGVVAKHYAHAVHFSGSYDGVYCGECDRKLNERPVNRLHNLYVKIQNLRVESDAWHKDFDKRSDEVEKEIAKIREGA